jgi:hypothetical protein
MMPAQDQIDRSQGRRRQLRINLVFTLPINILDANGDPLGNRLTFCGGKGAKGPPQQWQHVDELAVVQLTDPLVE